MSRTLRQILMLLGVGALCMLSAACGGSTHGTVGTGSAGAPPTHPTDSHLQSILQENDLLLYSTPQQQYHTLLQIKALGVDVVKVPLIWSLVGPDPLSTRRPASFDATDPAAYRWGSWNRYDLLVEEAQHLGLRVYFQFTPPIPRWAVEPNLPQNQGEALGQAPSPSEFEQFVEAAGRRYSGSWHDIHGRTIPRVSEWGIWNEPNWRNWLNPIELDVGGVHVTSQPMLYRSLVNAAWKALSATGHSSDTILIGETANIGSVTPIQFAEDLYCVGPTFQALTGAAAQAAGCPASGERSSFVAQNPGLFHMTGYAHHPYDFDIPPSQRSRVPTEVSLANIDQLERVLNGIFAGYGQRRSGGVPIYLSEWGYVTNPPNPSYHTSLAEQAAWLNEGEYMMWRQPFVKALAQFLLVDVPTPRGASTDSLAVRHAFTTGLKFYGGTPKPALAAYRLPIWVPVPRPGPHVAIWAQLRPADHSGPQMGSIEFQASGSTTWRSLTAVSTESPEGFVLARVAIPSSGRLRLAWRSPSGAVFHSRSVAVR